MKEFEDRINEIKQSNVNAEVPSDVVNSLNDIIMEGTPSTVIEVLRQEVKELSHVVPTDWFATDGLRNVAIDLHKRFNAPLQHSGGSSVLLSGNLSPQSSDRQINVMKPSRRESCSKEQDIVKKGIERSEKQILQYINVYISKDQINIALIKNCKTTDIHAVNSAIVYIQKVLQKYVGFSGMDPEYCDRIGELMDRAQAKVHSSNTSTGDSVDVGIFYDNSQVTVFEFLESAELAYLG